MSARDDMDGKAFVAQAITEHLGERCPDFDPSCPCCRAWEAYDRILAPGKLDDASLEVAAKVADEYPKRDPGEDGNGYWAAEEIAEAIRNLRSAG